MKIAYCLFGPDNDTHMWASPEVTCPACGCSTVPVATNPEFRLKKHKLDVSFTYDGACIVSSAFKDLCANEAGAQFQSLLKEPGFYRFMASQVVPFDAERRSTRFERLCAQCHNYESVVGATPAYLKGVSSPLQRGVYRTDLSFGSGNEKSPLLIVSPDVQERIHTAKLRGAEFSAIEP